MATDQRHSNTVQLITFAIDVEPDAVRKWMTTSVRRGSTVAMIAAYRGHPEDARLIADHNDIRSVYSILGRKKIQVPVDTAVKNRLNVMPGDGPPVIVAGYAKIDVIDRPQRTGLTMFTGYDPIQMDVPIRFESHYYDPETDRIRAGLDIERDIALLELMAGRGIGSVSGSAPPPTVQVTVRNGETLIPLISRNYQVDDDNKSAPVWRINGIDWEESVRNASGNRIRQLATVHLRQHTRLSLLQRGVTARAQNKKPAAFKSRVRR